MSVEGVIADRLDANVTLAVLVGSRNYQLKVRQGSAFPANRIQFITGLTGHHLRGKIDLKFARIQIDSYGIEVGSDPYEAVVAVADAVEDALDGVVFTLGAFRVTGAFQIIRTTEHEPGAQPLIRIRQDFGVHYKRIS